MTCWLWRYNEKMPNWAAFGSRFLDRGRDVGLHAVPDNPAESSSGVTKRIFSRSWTPTSFRLCERGKSSPWQPRHECIKQLSLSETMKHIVQMNNINNSKYLWWVWLKVGETFCSRSSLPADEDGDVFQKSSSCVLVCLNTSQRRRRRSQAKAKTVNPEFFSPWEK